MVFLSEHFFKSYFQVNYSQFLNIYQNGGILNNFQKCVFSLIKKWNKWEIDHRIEFKLRFYPFDYIFSDVRLKVEHASRSRILDRLETLERIQFSDHLDCPSSTQFVSNLDQQIDHSGISCGVNDLYHAFGHNFLGILHIIWPIWIKS